MPFRSLSENVMARKVAKQQSKKTYLAKRKNRVRELYIHDRMQPRDIAARLVADGVIETTDESLESAVRLVRDDVREIREELVRYRSGDAAPAVAFDEIDAMENELADLRREHTRQRMIADGEPTENCARSGIAVTACANKDCLNGEHRPFIGPAVGISVTNTPQGPMVTYKALWPAGVRQKASKDAALIAEKISKLEVALSEKRAAANPAPDAKKDSATADVFRVVASGKPMNELITENANRIN